MRGGDAPDRCAAARIDGGSAALDPGRPRWLEPRRCGEARTILDAIDQRGGALHRLGVTVGPLALDYTDAQLRILIERACLNNPAMVRQARRIARRVIGPAIAEQVANLRQTGDEGLFAGVIVGWETAIGQDYASRRDLGYCALRNLGYSERSPPGQPDRALETVVRNWIGTWSKALVDSGISSDWICSYITFDSRKRFNEARNPDGRSFKSS